jgi:hypothetical protein
MSDELKSDDIRMCRNLGVAISNIASGTILSFYYFLTDCVLAALKLTELPVYEMSGEVYFENTGDDYTKHIDYEIN